MGCATNKLWVSVQMNIFIGFLPIVTTLSYRNYKIAITVTHNQLTLSRYKTALSGISHTL
jgi:hypothetical protein